MSAPENRATALNRQKRWAPPTIAFACATARQTTADWIAAQVRALEFFGGVPRLIEPDQARALIKNPDTERAPKRARPLRRCHALVLELRLRLLTREQDEQ